MLLHFAVLAAQHPLQIVRQYASGFVLVQLAALRLRDTQRATVDVGPALLGQGYVSGRCFTSKHPTRRSPLPMHFFVPAETSVGGLLGAWYTPLATRPAHLDYLFSRPKYPRGKNITHPEASYTDAPAPTATVIAQMRVLLRQPPLQLSAAEA